MYMKRRQFARLSALTLVGSALGSRLPAQAAAHLSPQASTPILPPADGPDNGEPVGYALIGLGVISDIFGRACLQLAGKGIRVTALVTGHGETKGREWAARYGLPESAIYSYENFDRIRDNRNVQAVYVGLPNSMHREYTERAARAGKHVLCEKPMAISSAECRSMIDACRRANVKLMIAYRCHFDPTHLETERIIQSGAIGQLQAFEGSFGFNAPTRPFWRLDPKLGGGGALMDMGIYPLNAIRYFTRENPSGFTAVASTRDTTSGRFRGVEQTLEFTMAFPSGILASIGTSYGEEMPGILRIHGDKGTLQLAPAFDYTGIHLESLKSGVVADATSPSEQTTHFQLEASHFAHCIRTGATPRTPGEEGLQDLLAIEQIYRSAGRPIA